MKKKTLLITTAALALFAGNVQAQLVDVTSQYITNPGFEECEAVEITECKGYGTTVHGNGHCLMLESSVAHGYDYASTGWQLVEQNKNANGGVVSYGNKVQYSKSGFEDIPAAGPTANSGTKALCFCGNNNLIYKQPAEVTLPAGSYKMTVNIYPYNGAYSSSQPTTKVKTFTGFVGNDGTEYFSEERSDNNEITLNSNAWNQEVVYFELTKPTTGHIQVSYGIQYFLVIDDIQLEGETGIVTSGLKKVITKANVLNAKLNNSELATAIQNAEAFIANPTSQDEVTTQTETLYTAMGTALSASTEVVDITAAYLENASFEAERKKPWVWGDKSGTISEPDEMYQPFIDGIKIAEFTQGGSILQTISNLPAGYYALDAKLNNAAYLILGNSADSKTICTGGKDPIFLRYHPAIFQMATPADVVVGVQGSGKFRADDFRLFYGKDAASLEARLLVDVKADAQAILNNESFSAVTGSERTAIETAIEGNDAAAVNRAVNTFITAIDSYNAFTKKKKDAANYTQAVYPYASATIFETIQEIVNTTATSASNATDMTTQLDDLFFQAYVSNAYCEGVEKTDYTENIKEANIAAATEYWATQNMAVIQLTSSKAWKNPKTNEADNIVFGTSSSYNYNEATKKALILKQTIAGLPAGKYVLSITMMASTNMNVYVFFNGNQIGTMVGKGTASGGKYGAGWNDYTFEFTKTGDDAQPIQIQATPANNYSKELYLDNFRLYLLSTDPTGIQTVNRQTTDSKAVFDLQGRRIAQPGKGLYIVNGKKVIIK
jgi:hypothetical protein